MSLIPFPTAAQEQPKILRQHPAYCDPNNEVRGEKFDRELTTVEIAKRIREEVKAAIKTGTLPAMKVSVRSHDHNSIGISISDMADCPYTPLYIAARVAGLDLHYTPWRDQVLNESARKALDTVERMAKAYRRDNSDISSDYFDCNFYLNVSFDGSWSRAAEKKAMDAEREKPTIECRGEHGRLSGYTVLELPY